MPLEGLRVIDISTVVAGPNCAKYLGDFGADVIKVEQPGVGDSMRNMAWRDPRDGEGMWWKMIGRNKRTVALNLKEQDDREVFWRLVEGADVLVENFRPGVLERLGFAPDALLERNPHLVITRVSGFGQTGPYAQRPGFATIAESMSGLASITGVPGGAPLLPPIALTDEVTGLSAAFATMVALYSGVGQVVDVNLLETIFQLIGVLPTLYALTGEQQQRMGSAIPYSVPRGTFECSDGRWVGISASADSVARRVLMLLGVADDPRFATFNDRVTNREALDTLLADFCKAHTSDEVVQIFTDAEAAAGPVLDMADIADDPHFNERGNIVELDGTPMQGLIARLSRTPGRLRWQGRKIDEDGDRIRAYGWD